ncbi:ATP-binding protein [Nostoc spongiaeforme FACHB-130]|uniref:ATP-binding protein n=1 Tax=Nostoc spongiaeforme FACHB-130 TaxID=1357510 RepID=A0ABR8G4H9_9NOSO|nr:P-loop NTPase fold protein [Nostoc spongiaeforme]MBD2598066.1 ATP-binding protein [Nostoc spongiaeforme FACHB-130]
MSNELQESFKQAYANLELFPLLEKKETESFRVDYGNDSIEKLIQYIEYSPNGDAKIIFTGHTGCGKSSLLAELSRQIEDNYFVVLFSIADSIERSAVDHINILFAIALNLMSEAEARKVEINKSIKEKIYGWFATRTRTTETELGGGLEVGFDLLKSIKAQLKADAKVREEITQEFERKISDLVARINEIAALIQTASKKETIVIIDDLDKLDLERVNEIYGYNIKSLFQPNIRIIYTVPIAVMCNTFLWNIIKAESNYRIVVMPVIKIFSKSDNRLIDAKPRTEANNILCEILQKRISSELIDKSAAEKIVVYSGGVLRELIRIANVCCLICLRLIKQTPEAKIVIDSQVIEQAIKEIRNELSLRLGKEDFKILKTIYEDFEPDDVKQSEFLELLHGLFILEYRNDETWYDVHPILIETLKRRGLIN